MYIKIYQKKKRKLGILNNFNINYEFSNSMKIDKTSFNCGNKIK